MKDKKMATYQVLYWHDIPVQVKAKHRRSRFSIELPKRFQLAVDNAAMQAKITGTEAYLDTFHWSRPEQREGTPEDVAKEVAAEIESKFSQIDWRKTAESLSVAS